MKKFIVFEGIDGCGKSTLIKHLASFAETHKIKVNTFFEPTDKNPWGVEIRNKIKKVVADNSVFATELLDLFKKDRMWDIENQIQPSLDSSTLVLLDRYYLSTAAYQSHTIENIQEIMNSYIKDKAILVPDMVFFLKIHPQVALKRIQNRQQVKDIFEKEESLKRIAENYNYVFEHFSLPFPVFYLDAHQSQAELVQQAAELIFL